MSEPASHVTDRQGATTHGGAYAALVLMVAIWALNFSISKAALDAIEPMAFNALRFPLAALVVLLALRLRGRLPRPARRDLPKVLMLGMVGNVVYQIFFILGLDNTRAGTASVLLAATPILTAVLSTLAGHEQVGSRMWIGVISTFAGIVLVVTASQSLGGGTLIGDLLMLGASASWAVYTVGSRPLVAQYGSVAITAWTLWAGAIVLVLLGLPAVVRLNPGTLPSAVWLAVLYSGALSIGVAYLIWYSAVRRIGNTRTAAFSNLTPAVALGVAWIWLGEVPQPQQVTGAGIIIAGVMLVSRPGAGGDRPAGSVWGGGARPRR